MVARALQVIANHRNDYSLQLRAAAMENGNTESALTPDQAYKALQIKDSNTSDESAFAYFQTLINDAPPGSKTSFTEALWVIARARNSEYLFAKLRDPNAVVKPQRGTKNDPVGLANIGNTCYLNSLLQYYFTVKTVRDIVLNFEEYRMPLTAENILKKRVGGRAVRKEEIVNGHACM
jgi:ubiquitin carboxyl-terminal hydrolase 25/28